MARVAYGERNSIQNAIDTNVIPLNTLIIAKSNIGFETLFYDVNENLSSIMECTRFETLLEAERWAKKSSCIGLIVTVKKDSEWVPYIVQSDNTLKPFTFKPKGDGKTISVNDEGIISIFGLDDTDGAFDKAKSYQPVYKDGALTWVELDCTTVEGLQNLEKKIGAVAEGKTVVQMINEAQKAATYDDAALTGRIKVIEDDYLKGVDKVELETAISTAKTEAIKVAIASVLGEGTSKDFDTLKEVADWILSDTTGAAALMTRVTTIENDYLKGADKTELQGAINTLEGFIGILPEGVVSTTVIGYVQEVVNDLKIGDYAKAADLIDLVKRVAAIETSITHLTNKIDTFEADTDTQYTIVKVSDYQYKLQFKSKGDATFTDTGITIDIPQSDNLEECSEEDIDALFEIIT